MPITDADWIALVQRVTRVEENLKTLLENDIPHIREELGWIRDRLNRGSRPTWSMTAIVAFLSSLSVGLLVALMR